VAPDGPGTRGRRRRMNDFFLKGFRSWTAVELVPNGVLDSEEGQLFLMNECQTVVSRGFASPIRSAKEINSSSIEATFSDQISLKKVAVPAFNPEKSSFTIHLCNNVETPTFYSLILSSFPSFLPDL
jgi:hypothetical protein